MLASLRAAAADRPDQNPSAVSRCVMRFHDEQKRCDMRGAEIDRKSGVRKGAIRKQTWLVCPSALLCWSRYGRAIYLFLMSCPVVLHQSCRKRKGDEACVSSIPIAQEYRLKVVNKNTPDNNSEHIDARPRQRYISGASLCVPQPLCFHEPPRRLVTEEEET